MKKNGKYQDLIEALNWFRLSAKQGNAAAQNNLGLMYEAGMGTQKDYKKAYVWLSLAGAQRPDKRKVSKERLMRKMSAIEFFDAENLLRYCEAGNLKNCE